jgi:tetratricopeptide (TPR) repeat protein
VRALRSAPATLPGLAAVVVLVAWATSQDGYPVTDWAPGALVLVALLVVAAVVVPGRLADVPALVRIALALLSAFTLWSFASIAWAADQAAAWEGANRTLLYLVVFALFALWPQREQGSSLILGAWTLAMAVLAAITLLRVAGSPHPRTFFAGDRLIDPAGYPNANAAIFLMPLWPALSLARAPRLPWALRGVLAAAAVVLADTALLSQSRGSLFAVPIVVLLMFVLLPGRVRLFAVLVPVAAAVAASAPAVLRAGDRLGAQGDPGSAIAAATRAALIAALAAGVVVAVAAAVERSREHDRALAERLHRVGALAAALVAVGAIVAGLAVAGDPVARIRDGWHSFRGGYAESSAGSRLVGGLGSNRYDFYRVALDRFAAHPLEGIGADNFSQDYLVARRSDETPRYPHSVELRTLSETGIVGALLLGGALAAALAAALGAGLAARRRGGPLAGEVGAGALDAGLAAARRGGPLVGAVGAGALGAFAYWFVHGSADWFWEFAGLGAPAFAALGLAGALAPRSLAPSRGVKPLRSTPVAVAVAVVTAALAATSLALPWLAELDVQRAAQEWPQQPQKAYARLHQAAELNPLAARPHLIAGGIALRLGDLAGADHEFAAALSRNPRDAYATLERGAIASTRGDLTGARRLLARALALDPRDPLARAAWERARAGGRVSVDALNRSILTKGRQLQR